LSLEEGTDTLPRNVGKVTTQRCAISQRSADVTIFTSFFYSFALPPLPFFLSLDPFSFFMLFGIKS
jgi:hypothetical protein